MRTIIKFSVFIFLAGFIACKKDKKDPGPAQPVVSVAPTGTLKIDFTHMVDTSALVLNQKSYRNANGDTFTVSKFRYYISNIVFTKNDNSTYTEANSYHLVDCSDPTTTTITVSKVPFASYKSVTFMLGVDSAENLAGVQTGDLDPSKGMFWSWIGYTMLKFEGTSPQSGALDKSLEFHIGGYGGVDKTQRNFTFNFASATANVSSTITPQMHLMVNINELFKTPNLIGFSTQYSQMTPGHGSKAFADNYADMITFGSIQN